MIPSGSTLGLADGPDVLVISQTYRPTPPCSGVAMAETVTCWLTLGLSETVKSAGSRGAERSEEHTSELQSRENLVCRLLLEKKNKIKIIPLMMTQLRQH